jgi:alpha-1,6-mannosyltransferase
LKTLHLTNAWHSQSGGVGTFYRALFEAAGNEGHQMRLIVPGTSTLTERVGKSGLIYHITGPPAPVAGSYRMLYPHRFLLPGTAIQRIINAEQPDLIEISEKYTLPYLAGLLRTRRLPGIRVRPAVVGVSHERMDENMAAYFTERPAAASFCQWYMKSIYFPMFDHHLTVSEHTAQELIDASHGHKVKRGIWVTPMGVDCERFTGSSRTPHLRAKLLQQVGAEEGTTILLYVGRLSPEKNLSLLLDTMECLDARDYRLCIAGGGPLLEELRGACARRNLRHVVFIGHVPDRATLAEIYANADAFIHPNPREPFGIAPLEGMASCLPLIAPNTGGVTAYADGSNAWLANAEPEAFAAAARSLRAKPGERDRKVFKARLTAERFCWPAVTKHILGLYGQLIAITKDPRILPKIAPRAWSTPGDFLGRELHPRTNAALTTK